LEIVLEERVKGYRYGSQYIPVTPADEDNFKIPGPPVIRVIGLIGREKVPRHHFLDAPTYLHPAIDSESAHFCFSSIAVTLLKENKIALARFVKRENSDPSLIALLPQINEENSMTSFLLYRIPFSDDVREYNFPSLISFASEKHVKSTPALNKQRQAMEDFVDQLTINDFSRSNTTPGNATLENIYATLHSHLLGLDDEEDEKKVVVPDYQTLLKRNDKKVFADSLYDFFPLEKVEKKSRKKKVFFSDEGEGAQGATPTEGGGGGDQKRAKIEIDVSQMNAAIQADTAKNVLPKPAHLPPAPVPPSNSGRTTTPKASSSSSSSSAAAVVPPATPTTATTTSSSSVPPKREQDREEEEEEEEDNLNLPEFSVGTATPVEDFQSLINAIRAVVPTLSPEERKKRIHRAEETLTKVIQRNVALGGSRTHYKRAVSCLVLLREVSVAEKDCEIFNNYLQLFKKNYQKGRHALAWQLATDQLITLVAKSEVKSSQFKDDQAEEFLADIDNEGRDEEEEGDEEGAV
jgi:hypothetical protein